MCIAIMESSRNFDQIAWKYMSSKMNGSRLIWVIFGGEWICIDNNKNIIIYSFFSKSVNFI